MEVGSLRCHLTAVTNAVDNFTMSASPSPVPGMPFTLTWNPDTSGEIAILLNNFDHVYQTLDIVTFADEFASQYHFIPSPA